MRPHLARRAWPKLSQTLPHPRRPGLCQACGTEVGELARWQECDDTDQPTDVVVILCTACADQRIDKHPRLYHDLHVHAPMPGSMALCLACRRRDGLRCTHPAQRANGGAGLSITAPQPRTIFWDGTTTGGGRRTGWTEAVYPSPPSACAGREETDGQ